jgi:hypothetical protein
MVKESFYYINTKLPDTVTVSYFDVETGQNLTAEEWKRLHPEVSSSEIRIINQGEVYRSWKTDADYPAYGPMPFVDEATALIIARSDYIMVRLNREYPNIVTLFNHNRSGTVEWLKAEGALTGHNVTYAFKLDFRNDTIRSGPKAWEEYRNEIEKYVAGICKKWRDKVGDFESRLEPARRVLSDCIHEKHQTKFSHWPEVGRENVANIELDIGGSYEKDSYYIVWSCNGWMSIKDQRPERYVYMAEFRGEPNIKILQLDGDELKKLNRKVNSLRGGVEEAKRMIDAKEGNRDQELLTWDDFK